MTVPCLALPVDRALPCPARRTAGAGGSSAADAVNTIYVGNLPATVDEYVLACTFVHFGPVTHVQVRSRVVQAGRVLGGQEGCEGRVNGEVLMLLSHWLSLGQTLWGRGRGESAGDCPLGETS